MRSEGSPAEYHRDDRQKSRFNSNAMIVPERRVLAGYSSGTMVLENPASGYCQQRESALTSTLRRRRIEPGGWMSFRTILAFSLGCALWGVVSLAQTAPAVVPSSEGFGHDPEDAYLSSVRYTNAFFGFDFTLVREAGLTPVPQPAAMGRQIQLLEMAGGTPAHAAVSLAAYEYKNKNYTDAKGILRKDLDQELFIGVQELHGIGKTTVGGRPFFYYETRRGIDQHIVLAGEMTGYVLKADLRARDIQLLHQMLAAFNNAEFFPVNEAQRRAGADAKVYQGPAVSAQHLREVREEVPAEHIDPGKIEGNVYRNSQLGVTYEFPKGWNVEPAGAIEPAVERYREKVTGEPLLGPRERAVVKACRRTLLSLWRTKPQSSGDVPYDDFGEATLSVMPLSCFPNIRFPEDVKDSAAVRQFIVGLSFTQPLQRDMTVARSYAINGKTFVVTQGTIAYKDDGDALSKRVSVALAMTESRGYLLTWLFAAPHESELRELLAAKVSFVSDSESAGQPSSITPTSPESASTAPSAPAQATPPVPAPTAGEKTTTTEDTGVPQSYPRPSLLRDGETAETAQKAGQNSTTSPK